jgi:hypothetical protein
MLPVQQVANVCRFYMRRQEFFTALVNGGGRGARIFKITSMREFFAAVLGCGSRQSELRERVPVASGVSNFQF